MENTPARMQAWNIFRDANAKLSLGEHPLETGHAKAGMEEIFGELKHAAVLRWDSYPEGFFKKLGEELEKAGIDEGKFASFMKAEVEKTLPLILLQRAIGVVGSDPGKNTLKFVLKEGERAIELLTIARCMESARQEGMTAEKYFGNMGEEIARIIVRVNRKKVIDGIKDLAVETKNPREKGSQGSK
jgi:hypothetical protein